LGFFDFISSDVGIDLGTANTLVFVRGQGIVLNEPSVVAVEKATGKVLAVGSAAKEMLGRTPYEISAIRPLRDGVIADFEISEKLLSDFIRRVVKHRYLMKPRIVISVPSGITEVEKRAVRDSAENAGAREVFLLQEPMAAAIGVGLPVDQPSGIMVIDIGGGTSEIAVIALNGIVNNISVRIAGDEMNDSIVMYLKKNYNLLIGELTSEEIKIKIGSALPLEEELAMDIKGRDMLSGLPRTTEIKSNEVVKAIGKELREMIKAIKDVFQETPPELAADIIDGGIIMTGGTSQLRNFPELIRRRTGVKAKVAEQALFCVAKGTGIALEHIDVYKRAVLAKK